MNKDSLSEYASSPKSLMLNFGLREGSAFSFKLQALHHEMLVANGQSCSPVILFHSFPAKSKRSEEANVSIIATNCQYGPRPQKVTTTLPLHF